MKQNIQKTPIGWSAAEVETLQRHWSAGLTTAEIASRLDKTMRAVECKVYKLRAQGWVLPARRRGTSDRHAGDGIDRGIRPDKRVIRRCLYCGEDFASSHKGNRICPGCLEDGPFTSAMV